MQLEPFARAALLATIAGADKRSLSNGGPSRVSSVLRKEPNLYTHIQLLFLCSFLSNCIKNFDLHEDTRTSSYEIKSAIIA